MPLYYAAARLSCRVTALEGRPALEFTGPFADIPDKEHTVVVLGTEMARYESGESTQVAFARLSLGDREFLMTGISDQNWDDLTRDPEDVVADDETCGNFPHCPNCGGELAGDGYTEVVHCATVDPPADLEPDAAPVYCTVNDDEEEIFGGGIPVDD